MTQQEVIEECQAMMDNGADIVLVGVLLTVRLLVFLGTVKIVQKTK